MDHSPKDILGKLSKQVSDNRDGQQGRPDGQDTRRPTMETDTFDIFCGYSDRDAIWIEAVDGIDRARQRLKEIADDKPGDYFIFYTRSQTVLDRVNASKDGSGEQSPPKSGAL